MTIQMRILTKNPSQKQVKIDKIDEKILAELKDDARMPITQIAKKTKVSRTTVEYRINQLIKNDIITNFVTIIDLKKLGFYSYHLFIESTKHENEIIKKCLAHKAVNTILTYNGKLSMEISILARGPIECEKYIKEIFDGLPVSYHNLIILTKTIVSKMLPNSETIPIKKKNDKPIEYSPDEKDLQVLKILSDNAKETYDSIGAKLLINRNTIKKKVQNMEKSNIIIGYRPAINFESLGYNVETVLIKLKKREKLKEFEKFLSTYKQIIWASETIGNYDYILYFATKSLKEFHLAIRSMRHEFEDIILEMEALIAYEEHKYSYFGDIVCE